MNGIVLILQVFGMYRQNIRQISVFLQNGPQLPIKFKKSVQKGSNYFSIDQGAYKEGGAMEIDAHLFCDAK